MSYALLNAARSRGHVMHPARSQPHGRPLRPHLRKPAQKTHVAGLLAGIAAGAAILFLGGAMFGMAVQMDTPRPLPATPPAQVTAAPPPAPEPAAAPARPIRATLPPLEPIYVPYAAVAGVMPVPLGRAPADETPALPPTAQEAQVLRQLPPISSVSLVLPGFGMVPREGEAPLTTPMAPAGNTPANVMSLAEALARMPKLPTGTEAAVAAGLADDSPVAAQTQRGPAIRQPGGSSTAIRQGGVSITRPSRPVETSAPAAGGRFIVQAASFQNENSADAMVARLKRAGLPARLVTGGGWHSVRVGPYPGRGEAEAALGTVQAEGGKGAQIIDTRD